MRLETFRNGSGKRRGVWSALRLGITAWMIAFLTGCTSIAENSLTGRVWTGDRFCDYRTVSTNAPIELFQVQDQNDYLISYTEITRDGSKRRHRAYLIRSNADAIAAGERPHFARRNFEGLAPIPINTTDTNVPRATLTRDLVIETSDGREGPYALPKYKTGKPTAAQYALTPLSVTGDVAIAAGIIVVVGGLLYLDARNDCDSEFDFD
jgi:hypothetical protein